MVTGDHSDMEAPATRRIVCKPGTNRVPAIQTEGEVYRVCIRIRTASSTGSA
jgi:hypothetical protein